MPAINVRKELYDAIIRIGEDPTIFVNSAVREKLESEENGRKTA